MTLDERLDSFIRLGEILRQYPGTEEMEALNGLREAARTAVNKNGWFTPDHIAAALSAIGESLQPMVLEKWIALYRNLMDDTFRTVGVVMPGNIPAVGFHDFLCVLISGNRLNAKLASGDSELLPAMSRILVSFNPEWNEYITFTNGRLETFDAIIATGSNNSSQYFEFYFKTYPHIIRRHRNSVAILMGTETALELERLADDVFLYFGMGCRNVSKIFVPYDFDFNRLPAAFRKYDHFCNHNKYRNNYDYMKSIFLINKVPFLDTGSLLITADKAISSPISVLHYEHYNKITDVAGVLVKAADEIQCVVAATDPGIPFVLPGQTQSPALWEYADGIDTMKFLMEGKS